MGSPARGAPQQPITPSQAVSEARLALKVGEPGRDAALLRGISWDIERLSVEETRRFADACAAVGLLVEEVEARNQLVARDPRDRQTWARLARLHPRLGDRVSARRCRQQARRRQPRAGPRSSPRSRLADGLRQVGCSALVLAAAIWLLRSCG